MEIWDLKLTNFTKIYTLRGKRCLMSHIFFAQNWKVWGPQFYEFASCHTTQIGNDKSGSKAYFLVGMKKIGKNGTLTGPTIPLLSFHI